MTLRETVGQLFMIGFADTSLTRALTDLITFCRPGGVIVFRRNLESAHQILRLTNDLQAFAGSSPLFIAIDQEGGRVSRLPSDFTVFPACGPIAACHSVDEVRRIASITAKELRAVGINMNMAPVLDVHSNPQNPIIGNRAYGADPETVSRYALATIDGLHEHRVIACGKHFPGHGDTDTDSHLALPVITATRERLMTVEVPPFRAAIRHGLETIMTAHILFPALDPDVPATLSPTILQGLLRQELGFHGLILSDDLEMRAIIDHYGIGEAAVLALEAGADILLVCKEADRVHTAIEAVEAAVKSGRLPLSRLEASLRRITAVKERFLLPYTAADPDLATQTVGHAEHRRLCEDVSRRLATPQGTSV